MDTVFIILKIVKHIILILIPTILNLSDEMSDKYVAVASRSIYYTWKYIVKSYENNEFKISGPTLKEKFELPDGLYSVTDIQDYLQYIIKTMKHLLIIFQSKYTKIKQKIE